MNYGIPYMGSKSKIAESICSIFPSNENFYDLFGGGFSVTHAMLVNRKKDFKFFHFNEIRKGMPEFIKDCINGKYSYENFKPEFVSREEFFEKKDESLYHKIIWSFGNNGESYLFSKEIEKYKKSLHNAIVFDEFDEYAINFFGFSKFKDGYSIKDKRLFCKYRIQKLKKERCDLQQLEQLQRLQQLEQLQRLQQLSFYNCDYREVEIKNNSIVYCDIPYFNTGEYDKNKNFNHNDFFSWAKSLNHPLFVSEYNIEKPFLKLIYTQKKRSTLQGGSSVQKVEKVYCNSIAFDMIMEESRKKYGTSRKTI